MKNTIIQKAFKPVLVELIQVSKLTFAQELHSIYIYGSVAQGTARAGISDLDICIIFNHQKDNQEQLIVEIQQQLLEKYDFLPKIDFDLGYIHDVLLIENKTYWGAWIKFFCTQVYGEDLSTYFKDVEINAEVIQSINSGYEKEISQYFYILKHSKKSKLELLNNKKSLIKRMIRLLPLTLTHVEAWPLGLDETIQQAITGHPEQKNDFLYLSQQLDNKALADSILLKNLQDIYYWIEDHILQ